MREYESWRSIPIPDGLPADWIAMKLAGFQRIYPELDDVYPLVKAYVQAQETTSAGNLAREFRFGYSCAAALIDRLEAEGIVSAYDEETVGRTVLKRA